jgi:hypothetical protein
MAGVKLWQMQHNKSWIGSFSSPKLCVARTSKASKYRLLSISIDFYPLLLLSITINQYRFLPITIVIDYYQSVSIFTHYYCYRLLSISIDFHPLLLLSITIDGNLGNASNKCRLESKQAVTSSACCPLSAKLQFSYQILLIKKISNIQLHESLPFRGRDVRWVRKDKSMSQRLFAAGPTQHQDCHTWKVLERSEVSCHTVCLLTVSRSSIHIFNKPISNKTQGRASRHAIR